MPPGSASTWPDTSNFGRAQQLADPEAGAALPDRRTDAGRDLLGAAGEGGPQALGDLERTLGRGMTFAHRQELVTAHASGDLARAEGTPQPVPHFGRQSFAGVVPQAVVLLLGP